MTGDDQRALLAAIVADPADDTVCLAYADCIEEHGNSARAEFIRLQIKAEHLHPDSNAHARLNSQTEDVVTKRQRARAGTWPDPRPLN